MTRNAFKGVRDPYLSTLEYWIIRGDELYTLLKAPIASRNVFRLF